MFQVDTTSNSDTRGLVVRTLSHVMDIPKPVIITITLLVYLQIFFMLIACTKQEPRFSLAYVWPWFLYSKLSCTKPVLSAGTDVYKTKPPTLDANPAQLHNMLHNLLICFYVFNLLFSSATFSSMVFFIYCFLTKIIFRKQRQFTSSYKNRFGFTDLILMAHLSSESIKYTPMTTSDKG